MMIVTTTTTPTRSTATTATTTLMVVLMILGVLFPSFSHGIEINDTICVEGIIMDCTGHSCWDVNPESNSTMAIFSTGPMEEQAVQRSGGGGDEEVSLFPDVLCMINLNSCDPESYKIPTLQVLLPHASGDYRPGWQVDEEGQEKLITLAQQDDMNRTCSKCNSTTDRQWARAMRATIEGTVLAAPTYDKLATLQVDKVYNGKSTSCASLLENENNNNDEEPSSSAGGGGGNALLTYWTTLLLVVPVFLAMMEGSK